MDRTSFTFKQWLQEAPAQLMPYETAEQIIQNVGKLLRVSSDDVGCRQKVINGRLNIFLVATLDEDTIMPDKVVFAQMKKSVDDIKGYNFTVQDQQGPARHSGKMAYSVVFTATKK